MPRPAGAAVWVCDGQRFIPWPTILAGLAGQSQSTGAHMGDCPSAVSHHKIFLPRDETFAPPGRHTGTGALQFPGVSAAPSSDHTPLARRCAFRSLQEAVKKQPSRKRSRRGGTQDRDRPTAAVTRGGWRPPSYPSTAGATPSFRGPRSRLRVSWRALEAMFSEEPFYAEKLASYTFTEFNPVKRHHGPSPGSACSADQSSRRYPDDSGCRFKLAIAKVALVKLGRTPAAC
jgi:hypothetical protein